MENKGLISVIIPVYNVEKYLRECVDSVLGQTYTKYEIILVDDGSTDASGKICDEYAAEFSQVSVIHKENGGLSDARNTGFAQALGEYIYFLDSDDFLVADAFEKLVLISTEEKSDFVFFDALSFSDKGNNYNIPQRYVRKRKYETQKGEEILCEQLKNKDYHSSVPLCFIRRSLLKGFGIDFVNGIFYEDMIFTYKLFMSSAVVSHCFEPLYHRRYRESSIMTTNKTKKYFDSVCKVYGDVLSFSKTEKKLQHNAAKKYIAKCAFNVFNNYEKLNSQDKRNSKKQLENVKKSILKDNAYGDKALKMRCYGKAFWFTYKVFEKTAGRLFV